ncbi:cyclic nucleotide-binding domain-containing protein [Chloroflexota bacterium]
MNVVDLIGHLSFIAIAASFFMRDILWLRIVSIVGSIFAILFNYFVAGGPIWLVIGWSIVFITINVFNIFILFNERRSVSFTPEEQEMYETVFKGFSPVEFMKLLRIGQWREVDEEQILIMEGQKVYEILFIYNGQAEVYSKGKILNYLKDGAFIGEMEYIEDKPAGATVKTTSLTRIIAWPTVEIKQLSLRNPSMRTTLQTIFSVDLMQKLQRQASTSDGN